MDTLWDKLSAEGRGAPFTSSRSHLIREATCKREIVAYDVFLPLFPKSCTDPGLSHLRSKT